MTILWTSKIMRITSIVVFDCWAGAASEKEVQSKSNNLFSSSVNQNSHLIPFLILLSQTYLLSIHLIYCIWSGNGAKEDPPWNCNRWLEIMKWQKRAERRKQLWKKKTYIDWFWTKPPNLMGEVWTLVLVEAEVILISHLSNSFIKVIRNKHTLLGNGSNCHYFSGIDIFFQNTVTTPGISCQSFLQPGIKCACLQQQKDPLTLEVVLVIWRRGDLMEGYESCSSWLSLWSLFPEMSGLTPFKTLGSLCFSDNWNLYIVSKFTVKQLILGLMIST